jgi:hypothetical protein
MPRFDRHVEPADAEPMRASVARQAAMLNETETNRPRKRTQ